MCVYMCVYIYMCVDTPICIFVCVCVSVYTQRSFLRKVQFLFLFLPAWIMVGISVNAWGKVPCKDVWNSFVPHKGDIWNL